ncbi:flagellar export chaperone FlgN [Pseudoalteromonas aurantia]|uniref:Flagellar biogenesis protein n=1 Tax=Pseudoalteromonas aurantia TaxID=43654 RepID=A0A5S3VBN1_9GAMM|nr:flagellar export chaperone FlgN [Pseudoalteromonas aurantia]TMO63237.1 flagellar biogenesis protein [Pseudoalteromonas aurantia]TMO69458.1 flagellar biogenesis protein [Pseudoalteromonas aurantia]TMO74446.1 flagellar biogenesis protein [Pseudoalteromonas aurantia]
MADQVTLCVHKLEIQRSNLTTLTQLLDGELDILASKKGEGLKDAAREKLTLLNAIQKLDKELATFSSETFQHDTVKKLTSSIKTLLLECKTKNDVNAKAAHQAQLSVRQLKEILIGSPNSITYGQDGSVVAGNSELVKDIKA